MEQYPPFGLRRVPRWESWRLRGSAQAEMITHVAAEAPATFPNSRWPWSSVRKVTSHRALCGRATELRFYSSDGQVPVSRERRLVGGAQTTDPFSISAWYFEVLVAPDPPTLEWMTTKREYQLSTSTTRSTSAIAAISAAQPQVSAWLEYLEFARTTSCEPRRFRVEWEGRPPFPLKRCNLASGVNRLQRRTGGETVVGSRSRCLIMPRVRGRSGLGTGRHESRVFRLSIAAAARGDGHHCRCKVTFPFPADHPARHFNHGQASR